MAMRPASNSGPYVPTCGPPVVADPNINHPAHFVVSAIGNANAVPAAVPEAPPLTPPVVSAAAAPRPPPPSPLPQTREAALANRLRNLARTLGRSFKLSLEPGKRWAYNAKANRLTYPVAEMLENSDTYNLGAVCRQIGRMLYSRALPPRWAHEPGFRFLHECVEAMRTGNIMSGRYPGVMPLLRELRGPLADPAFAGAILAAVHTSGLPRVAQLMIACEAQWLCGKSFASVIADADVKRALTAVGTPMEAAVAVPDSVDLAFDELTPDEASAAAAESLRVTCDDIWPIFAALLEKDIQDGMGADSADSSDDDGSGSDDEGADGAAQPGKPGKASKKSRKRRSAEKALQELLDKLGKGTEAPDESSDVQEAGEANQLHEDAAVDLEALIAAHQKKVDELSRSQFARMSPYRQLAQQNQRHIDDLTHELENFFNREQVPRLVGHYRSGNYDLKKAIQAECRFRATGKRDPLLFLRREQPQERSVELVFCVDISGSMRGAKIVAARAALVTFLESLQTLKIPNGVLAFDDDVSVLKPLQTALNEESLVRLLAAIEPKGGTDDKQALDAAVKMLESSQAQHQYIFYLTDGEGDQRQKEAVRTLESNNPRLKILGIGVGDGCAGVETTYFHRLLVPNVAELPRKLGEKLVEMMREDGR